MSPTSRRLATAALLALLLLLPHRPSLAGTAGEQIRLLYQEAQKAHEKKDYPVYYAKISRLAQLLPDDAETAFRQAAASALTGRTADAGRLLRRLTTFQACFDLAGNPDFAAVRGSAAFRSTVAAMEALKKTPVGTATVAFRLPERDFVPEAVAWDAGTKSFLVSSVQRRKVVRVGKDGIARELVPEGRDGLGSALGIEVDAPRRILYVCSTTLKQSRGARKEELDRAALLAFHADSGKLLGRWPLGGGRPGHSCDSLAVSSRGEVYVSDGMTGEVSRLRRGDKTLETFLPAGVLLSAQSPAFAPGEKVLFIPDYARGIFRVDLATRKAVLLPAPKDVDLSGVDGLVFHRGSLIAVQNGLEPARVLRLRLSSGLDHIEKVETLARALPAFDDPTLATVVDDTLYYVANSHWNKFDDDGRLHSPEKLAGPVVLKMPLQ
jgi:sugar lactone lactonase YvrE